MYKYFIKPHQKRILEEVKPLVNPIYNFTINQKYNTPNLTIKQMNRSIYRSVSRFLKEYLGTQYQSKDTEKDYIKYYCIYEVKGDFHKKQMDITSLCTKTDMSIHFHLFISPMKKGIPMELFSYILYEELTSFPHKKKCINEYGYRVYDSTPLDFILYHTKQYTEYPSSMIFKNY